MSRNQLLPEGGANRRALELAGAWRRGRSEHGQIRHVRRPQAPSFRPFPGFQCELEGTAGKCRQVDRCTGDLSTAAGGRFATTVA